MALSINSISDYYNRLNFYSDGSANDSGKAVDDKSAKKVDAAGKVECQTCNERKYQDVSADPGVSFKTPGRISPQSAAAVVKSHELEHVSHETAKAKKDNREIVSQSVSIHTGICPECGTSYVSGGTTRTVTKASANDSKDYFLSNYNDTVAQNFGLIFDVRV